VDPLMLAAGGPGKMFILQVLGFAVVVGVLVKLVFPQLGKILGGRTKGIEETFQKIDHDTQETAKRLEQIKAQLAQAGEESKKRLQAILDDAARTRTQLLADAHSQVQGALDKAKREIGIERDKAVLELRHEATDLTMRAAEHLVQSTMNDALQEKLVAKYLSELDGVKKT
jgi:F-type H+-transporting ATPase subunit b